MRKFGISILALFATVVVSAQQRATLRGRVTDQSGSFVRGATITLTGVGNANSTSGADGTYTFANLALGDYQISATAPQLSAEPIKVTLIGDRTVDLRMRINAAKEQVEVSDSSTAEVNVDPTSNANARVLKESDLEALADNPDDLQADLQALAGPGAGPSGGSILVDGFSGGQLPPKQSIREVRINQNPFSPENDRLGLGRIEILTKPGADKYRGSIAYNLGTDALNSRNPYAAEKAKLLLNEFENNGGGPLGKRASFALAFDRQLVDNGSVVNGITLAPNTLVPTPFNTVLTTPQRRVNVSPRVDYQVNNNNIITLGYQFMHTNVENAGIGAFDLTSRGDQRKNTYHTVQFTETSVHGTLVNESRFQLYHWDNRVAANSNDPAILVLGAFNGGGGQMGISSNVETSYEFQNYTTQIRGTHTVRFGVRLRGQSVDNVSPQNFSGAFTFTGTLAPQLDANNKPVGTTPIQISGIEQYRRATLFQSLGYTPVASAALGGGASQFSISGGNPSVSGDRFDAGVFAGDDWRVRPNLTLNLGLRYENQTNIADHFNLAPRIGIAWAPNAQAGRTQKTVIRAGFGIFYDRFSLNSTLSALRYNGINQQQYVVTNPVFYPTIPSLSTLAASKSRQVIRTIDPKLSSPYILQPAITIERQIPGSTTVAVTYSHSTAIHSLRSVDVNAPLPGTYNPQQPGSGVYPMGTADPLFLVSSSGRFRQNQIIVNANTRVNSQVSFSTSYSYNRASSNTDSTGTFPANPYNYDGEYGPASSDIRHRVQWTGSLNTRWNVRFSPNVTLQSGSPFDITTGSDLYGTTLFNGRPGIATDPNRTGVIQTKYGLLDPNPIPGEKILGRNFGRGPGAASVNLRVGKTFTFGGESSPAKGNGIFATPSSRRYNLAFSISARNILNHNNPGPIIGNITSRLFGQANQVAGAPNGEGFSENASNRRLEMQVRLTF